MAAEKGRQRRAAPGSWNLRGVEEERDFLAVEKRVRSRGPIISGSRETAAAQLSLSAAATCKGFGFPTRTAAQLAKNEVKFYFIFLPFRPQPLPVTPFPILPEIN